MIRKLLTAKLRRDPTALSAEGMLTQSSLWVLLPSPFSLFPVFPFCLPLPSFIHMYVYVHVHSEPAVVAKLRVKCVLQGEVCG